MQYPTITWASWDADPIIVIAILAISLTYGLSAARLRGTGLGPTRRQLWFVAGAIGSIVLALASPLHRLGEVYLFTAQMAQHVLLIMLMPPLLLASLTPAMLRPVVDRPRLMRIGRALTRPIVAYAASNLMFVVAHLPLFYEPSLRGHAVDVVEYLLLPIPAILLWWPLLSPLPDLPRIGYPAQLLYVFLQVVPGSIVGGLLANTERVVYQLYADAPRITSLSPVQDHQTGAFVMWGSGGIFWLVAFTVVFFRWAALDMAEERLRGISAPNTPWPSPPPPARRSG